MSQAPSGWTSSGGLRSDATRKRGPESADRPCLGFHTRMSRACNRQARCNHCAYATATAFPSAGTNSAQSAGSTARRRPQVLPYIADKAASRMIRKSQAQWASSYLNYSRAGYFVASIPFFPVFAIMKKEKRLLWTITKICDLITGKKPIKIHEEKWIIEAICNRTFFTEELYWTKSKETQKKYQLFVFILFGISFVLYLFEKIN